MDVERLFSRIYDSCFESGIPVITSRGGALDDYRECFQKAIVRFYQRILKIECRIQDSKELEDYTFFLQKKEGEKVVAGKPCAFIYGIIWRMYFKDLKTRPPFELREEIMDADFGKTEESSEWQEETMEKIAAYIKKQFNEVEQELIYLRNTGGLKYDEISAIFKDKFPGADYTPGYLRVMMNRVVRALRDFLNHSNDNQL